MGNAGIPTVQNAQGICAIPTWLKVAHITAIYIKI